MWHDCPGRLSCNIIAKLSFPIGMLNQHVLGPIANEQPRTSVCAHLEGSGSLHLRGCTGIVHTSYIHTVHYTHTIIYMRTYIQYTTRIQSYTYITYHYIMLHCIPKNNQKDNINITFHSIALQYIPPHYIHFTFSSTHSTALHHIALRTITLRLTMPHPCHYMILHACIHPRTHTHAHTHTHTSIHITCLRTVIIESNRLYILHQSMLTGNTKSASCHMRGWVWERVLQLRHGKHGQNSGSTRWLTCKCVLEHDHEASP